MKFCRNCGSEMVDEAVICVKCGCAVKEDKIKSSNDAPNGGFALLGFCIPIVGLILYLVWRDETPLKAKSAGKGALISVIIAGVIYLLYFILIIAIASAH